MGGVVNTISRLCVRPLFSTSSRSEYSKEKRANEEEMWYITGTLFQTWL